MKFGVQEILPFSETTGVTFVDPFTNEVLTHSDRWKQIEEEDKAKSEAKAKSYNLPDRRGIFNSKKEEDTSKRDNLIMVFIVLVVVGLVVLKKMK